MATINFNSTITKVDSSNLTLNNSYYIGLAVKTSHNDHLINTKTASDYTIPDSYAYAGLIYNTAKSYAINSTTAFSTSTFADGVYRATISESYDDGNTYVSTAYQLFTYAIDAGIAAYNPTTPTESANLIWMNYLRSQITDLSVDLSANQTLINALIGIIETTLPSPYTYTDPNILSLVDNNTIEIVAIKNNTISLPLNSISNYLWNTVTNEYVYFENNFLVTTGEGSASVDSNNTFYTPIYSDGVYFVYNFGGSAFDNINEIILLRYYSPIIITTTIDAEFATFEANYDPNNAAQLASYEAIVAAYAQIQYLKQYVYDEYDAINAQIAIIQDNLALWVELNMSLVLTNKSTMTLTINSTIPNVVYSEQSLTLNNTNDDSQEYTITTFPENYIDLTKTFSSSAINFGSQYDDAVYKVNLSWTADNGMEFSGVAYCLVMTQVNCGIAQIIAERPNCKQLQSKLNYLMTFREMAIDAYSNADYSTCNFYINKCIVILNQSGCGCGCN